MYIRNEGDSFQKRLKLFPNLQEAYEKQFIMASNFTYYIENVSVNHPKRAYAMRAKLEASGNAGRLAGLIFAGKLDYPYTIFTGANSIPFSQYVRWEYDIRSYLHFTQNATWANRLFVGMGIPYGNSKVLPFTKQYTAGGGYSNRGFQERSLGPGSYKADDAATARSFFQTGEMKIEMNTELRFGLWRWFKGAIYADAGNVWNIRDDVNKTDDVFQFKNLYKEIALSSGIGVRGDFSYFVFAI